MKFDAFLAKGRLFRYWCNNVKWIQDDYYRDNNEKEAVCTFSIRIGYITRYYACLKNGNVVLMHFRKSLVKIYNTFR